MLRQHPTHPGISNTNAAVLGLGALLFTVPILVNFNFESPLFKFSGQVGVQTAELKRELSDIKQVLGAIAKQIGGTAADISAAATSKKPAPVVLVIYAPEQKELALKYESYLLASRYAANAIFSDFSELSASGREKEGTVRFLYTERTRQIAEKLETELRAKFPESTRTVKSQRKTLANADVQIQLF